MNEAKSAVNKKEAEGLEQVISSDSLRYITLSGIYRDKVAGSTIRLCGLIGKKKKNLL